MVEAWGEVPIGILQQLNFRKQRYGFIGLNDHTMEPLLRPGSFVQIDERQKVPPPAMYRTEFDRPIWFLELRTAYLCSWCEFRPGRITSIPHPLSGCRTQEFAFPQEVEIVGRVTAVAARLVSALEPPSPPAPLPAQS